MSRSSVRASIDFLSNALRKSVKNIWLAYLLASILILWGFGWSLPDGHHLEKSFHADENAAVWAVNQIRFPAFNPHFFNWGTALFYQVYVAKLALVTTRLLPATDATLILLGRVIVWISAMGILTCLFLIGSKLFDEWTGRIAALVLAVIPGFVINSHYLKTDIPAVFWLMLAMAVGYGFYRTGSAGSTLALGFLLGYATSTKYNMAAAIPAGLVFLFAAQPRRLNLRRLVTFGFSILVGFLLGTPRILPFPGEFLNALHLVAGVGKEQSPAALARGPALIDYLFRVCRLTLTTPLWLASAIAVVWCAVRHSRKLLPVWAFLLPYLLLLSADNVRLMRYVTPLLPFAALFVAVMARDLWRDRRSRMVVSAGVGLLIAYGFVFTASYVRVMTQVDPRIQAAQWIATHVAPDQPFPVATTHYLGAPQVQRWGFQKQEIKTDVAALQAAPSPYLAMSEYLTQAYDGALPYLPEARRFFDYVDANYTAVATFENSQRLFGVDSKSSLTATHDWLYPNPRITIYRRNLINGVSAPPMSQPKP